ncbi:MAG: Slp family lipoprotein [Deltaproteobacteria bacterium]|nr:Slp family lipoprotein [Deltaproteobacteria bacterium]
MERKARSGGNRSFGLLLLLFALWGCGGPVISREIRKEALPVAGAVEIRENLEKHRGKAVIFGGELLDPVIRKEGTTTFFVLSYPLDWQEKPKRWNDSQGRFLVNARQLLDVYEAGRDVTIAGTVIGRETEAEGKRGERYVAIEARQIYVWPLPPVYPTVRDFRGPARPGCPSPLDYDAHWPMPPDCPSFPHP